VEISVENIRSNSLQPRSDFSQKSLGELQASIREHGVLQPVLVRPVSGSPGTYEVVAGERRWRAAAAAGLRAIPVVIRGMDDRSALESALVENLQREDLNPIERARAYQRLTHEFGLTQESLAQRVGRSQASVANTIRLLALPPEVISSVEGGRITEGHARALLALERMETILALWKRVESHGLSVRATEAAARRASISREMTQAARTRTRDINNIEQSISDRIGLPVRIITKKKQSGEIRIAFFSLDDFDRLMGILGERGSSSP
jgi:ParB family chromosome partitioning protein